MKLRPFHEHELLQNYSSHIGPTLMRADWYCQNGQGDRSNHALPETQLRQDRWPRTEVAARPIE